MALQWLTEKLLAEGGSAHRSYVALNKQTLLEAIRTTALDQVP